jgi:DNA-binding LacI/PurR family transcriptional regulator
LCTRTVDGVSESDYVDMLLDQHVSGVIFSGGLFAQAQAPHQHYFLLRERGLPVVLVNAAIDDIGFPIVATDDAHAVDQAYNHLTSLGHEDIGLILGPTDHIPSRRKQLAFEALVGAVPGTIERTMFSMEGGHAAANRLVKRGVTGIVCASDVLALGAMRAVRRLGLAVPADVSVVGFDDSAFMNCTDPPLTTVRQPIEAMGQAAVALLVSEIAGNTVPADEMLFEPELVVRGSTAPVRAVKQAPVPDPAGRTDALASVEAA